MGTTVPRVDSAQIARKNPKLKEAIDEALATTESPILLAYFFSIVPERGRALWGNFRRFQRVNGKDYEFSDYVVDVVDREPITRAFMPEGCRRPHREAFRPDMRKLIGSLEHVSKDPRETGYRGPVSDDQMLPAFLEEVYFGRGDSYKIVRHHHCTNCPVKNCRHHP